jgi:hypothetical protein
MVPASGLQVHIARDQADDLVDCQRPNGAVESSTTSDDLSGSNTINATAGRSSRRRTIPSTYDSAVHLLLGELGLSLLDASSKSEWHNITRPEALAARAALRLPAQVAA